MPPVKALVMASIMVLVMFMMLPLLVRALQVAKPLGVVLELASIHLLVTTSLDTLYNLLGDNVTLNPPEDTLMARVFAEVQQDGHCRQLGLSPPR